MKQVQKGIYYLNPEVLKNGSTQVDICVHPFCLIQGDFIPPSQRYSHNIWNRVKEARHPLICTAPENSFEFYQRFLTILNPAMPVFMAKTAPGDIPLIETDYKSLAEFIENEFKPKLVELYGAWLVNINGKISTQDGCVGLTFSSLKEHLPEEKIRINPSLCEIFNF